MISKVMIMNYEPENDFLEQEKLSKLDLPVVSVAPPGCFDRLPKTKAVKVFIIDIFEDQEMREVDAFS